MLMVAGDLQVAMRSDQAFLRYEFAGQQFEQRRFAF